MFYILTTDLVHKSSTSEGEACHWRSRLQTWCMHPCPWRRASVPPGARGGGSPPEYSPVHHRLVPKCCYCNSVRHFPICNNEYKKSLIYWNNSIFSILHWKNYSFPIFLIYFIYLKKFITKIYNFTKNIYGFFII